MADKSFGVDQLDILGTGTPTISAPNQLNLDAHTVAISTSVTVGEGMSAVNISATGISTIAQPADSNPMANWTITNNSASAYRFTGPGQSGSDDNPDLYLVRGHRYIFKHNATSSHPIQIRVASGGAAYTDGITYSDTGNNRTTDGNNLIINLQHDAPARLFYQCTAHGGMVGNIYTVGGPQVISGVVTATTFVGALTGTASGNATISSNSNDRIITGGSGNALTGEANLQFDGTNLFMSDELRHLGDPDTKIGFDTDTIKFETAGGERLRIDSSGKVGLGTTGSDYGLSIREADNSNKFLMLQKNSGQQLLQVREDGDNHVIFDGSHASGELHFYTAGSERLRIGSSGQIGIAGANYGTSGQVLTSQGSGSAVQWASPVVAGSILQTVYGTTTNEIVVTSTSFQNFTALNTSITRMSSNSHLWVWINAVRLLVQADSNEARVRITDGTSATTPYRLVNYDSDGNYLSFNPCLNWYWTKSHTAGTTVTITPQIRTINGNNVVWGDNGDTSMMIIQEIAR